LIFGENDACFLVQVVGKSDYVATTKRRISARLLWLRDPEHNERLTQKTAGLNINQCRICQNPVNSTALCAKKTPVKTTRVRSYRGFERKADHVLG
jgi:hypothetical protein